MTRQGKPISVTALVVMALVVCGTRVAEGQPRGEAGRRPSTPTVLGDTGLWFVPTAEVLPSGEWSLSSFRVNADRQQGFTDISHLAGSASLGVKNRLELFGSLNGLTRIDRDLRPLSVADLPATGGLDSEFPFVRDSFTEGFGDLSLGAKVNLLSQFRGHPAAFAVRSVVKVPTGEVAKGVSTGEPDVAVDAILSRAFGVVEVTGLGGAIVRGDAPDVDLPNGVRWGLGAGFLAPARLRLVTEIRGEAFLEDTVVAARPLIASDGSLSPLRSLVRNPVDALFGVTWQAPNGVFVGAGLSWAVRFSARDRVGLPTPVASGIGDRVGFQMGIGFRPGRRARPAQVVEAPDPRRNRQPTVTALCTPCTVEPGQPATVTAEATDPDGDLLNYRWHAPAGQFARATADVTTWTAPDREGPVVVTVEVDDDLGGRAADSVTLDVVAAADTVSLVLEDIHFDFDRYTLRPAALRTLDEAVRALMATPDLHVTIDGHTCNIGTAEYNIALADRRAAAVKEYLVGRGVHPARLTTIAYGEERPGFDNGREESRRLNRRAALVVELGAAPHGQGAVSQGQ